MSSLKDALSKAVESHSRVITQLSDDLYAHPELGHQEVYAQKRMTEALKGAGFTVEAPYGGLPTAFRATLKTGRPGPTVALLAEYD
ncbi:MAG: amidohydrolase, partial [Bacillota bacterium]